MAGKLSIGKLTYITMTLTPVYKQTRSPDYEIFFLLLLSHEKSIWIERPQPLDELGKLTVDLVNSCPSINSLHPFIRTDV